MCCKKNINQQSDWFCFEGFGVMRRMRWFVFTSQTDRIQTIWFADELWLSSNEKFIGDEHASERCVVVLLFVLLFVFLFVLLFVLLLVLLLAHSLVLSLVLFVRLNS